ncbi:hypothetical protein CEXT_778881 [Caerostris extrusa]|uniref:Uncharacterized protein n=1 Tax=Caerostris extrusa TaxID=172846 RepID=A0AAV4X893_CAEEX|nr:hypothetical protein CEXT_778881 [Caerostris extrusa]
MLAGGAPVGAYQRQQSPLQWYRVPRIRIIKQRIVRPFVRVVTVPPAIKPTPKVTKPRKPVSKPGQPKPKPSKITGRQAGGLLGLGGGGQKGMLGLGGMLGGVLG